MPPIPEFPAFRRLAITDRAQIEAVTNGFPPYSDFSFTSLWAWDTDETCVISMLGGNLVVRFKDFTSERHFYSFIGQDAVFDTAGTLLTYARQEGLPAQLRLIPETVIAADDRLPKVFSVAADRDNFDYVNATIGWASFKHGCFREHRRARNRCRNSGNLEFRVLDPGDPGCQDAMVGVAMRWADQKPACEEHRNELTALRRTFALTMDHQLHAGGFFERERMVGLSLWEGLPAGEWATIHFQKADRCYPGLSSWQAHEIGRLLLEQGYRLINGEQDLGIPGLRAFKESLCPCAYLKKYVIADRRQPWP